MTHKFESQIAEIPAEGPHKEVVPSPGKLNEVDAMTTFAGGLYVNDSGRFDAFEASTGAFLSQLAMPGNRESTIALGALTGETELYASAGSTGAMDAVDVFGDGVCGTLECPALQSEWTGADTPNESFASEKGEGSGRLTGIAVDESTSGKDWAKGDVFVSTVTGYRGQYPNLNVVDVFRPEAGGKEKYTGTQLKGTPLEGEPATGEGELFEHADGVVVSSFNGDVVVVDGHTEGPVLDVFEPVGLSEYAFVRRLAPSQGPFGSEVRVAVDAADGEIYMGGQVSVNGELQEPAVYQFGANGELLGVISGSEMPAGSFNRIQALAVNPVSGRVFVGNYDSESEHGIIDEFGKDEVLPDVTVTEPVSGFQIEPAAHTWSATLKGTVNPAKEGGEATCTFEYGTSTAYGKTAECTGPGSKASPLPEGEIAVGVQSALVTGLAPDTTYFYRTDATNLKDGQTNIGACPADCGQFTTPGPGIEEQSAADVASSSATLHATIDPDGQATSYRFEYDTRAYAQGEAAHGTSIPSVSAPSGAGTAEVTVEQHIQGLSPRVSYHYRVVATSDIGAGVIEEFDGPDSVFTTQSVSGALTLPDGRAWELVSPANKQGALIFGLVKPFSAPVQASANGRSVTYAALTPTESAPEGYSTVEQVVSRRGDAGAGWSSCDISPPHAAPTSAESFAEYQIFSEDLSSGLVQLVGLDGTLLSSQASEATPYSREDICAPASDTSERYMPLITGKEGVDRDVPPDTVFGGQAGPVGATPDMKHVVLRASAQLTETATEGHSELYEFSADKPGAQRLQLLSLLPENEGGGPSAATAIDLGNNPNEEISSGMRPISSDGSRVFWSTGSFSGTDEVRLYMRDTARGETVRLDVAQPGAAGGEANALFEEASVDGSRVFFTDTERLTVDASRHGADLYECVLVVSGGKGVCTLHDLTPESANGSSEVQNLVLGASEDGSYVYFVANGVLGSPAPSGVRHGACKTGSGVVVMCNLYVYHDGEVKFIATLSTEDELDWGGENGPDHTVGYLTARVSGNGQFVAFMSNRSLTGYDNRDVRSGKPDAEVFEYDAQTSGLVCVSCDPTGARPAGVEVNAVMEKGGADLAGIAEGVGFAYNSSSWVAGNLPAGVSLSPFRQGLYLPRGLSDSGRLFFNSSDALSSLDVNGQEDVYQYEPVGVGDCMTGASGYREQLGGCVGLISSGTSSGESGFLDSSASGDDVFFLTGEQLVGEDQDMALDVYDARVCTESEPCASTPVSPPACATADACRAAPSPQPQRFGAGPSETFSGAGNLVPPSPAVKQVTKKQAVKCKKGFVKKKSKCVKRFKSKKKTKSKKANDKRRASR